ncbi:MAG: AI-2E family transporter [Firmicutes bacterium]|nr:AI-2E family transporter [Bacillota bacterium]
MRIFNNVFDKKYLKIASYVGITAIITFLLILLIYRTGPTFSRILQLFLAVLKPLIVGGDICYLLTPFVRFFDKKLQSKFSGKTWTRTLSVIFCLLIIFGAGAAFITLLIISMTKSLSVLDFGTFSYLYHNTKTDFGDLFTQFQNILGDQGIDLHSIGKKVARHLTSFLSTTASTLSTLLFGFIFGVYFLIDGDNIGRYWSNAVKTIYSAKTIRVMKELLNDADRCFSGYIRGQVIDALLVGASVSIVFSLIGMPHAVTIGILTGIGNLIPYFGPVIGFLSVIIINLIQFDFKMILMGVAVLIAVMFIDSNFINPRLLAGTIQVHPLLVVASLLAGGAIGGIAGMLISVPCGAFLKLQFDKYLSWREARKRLLSEETGSTNGEAEDETISASEESA